MIPYPLMVDGWFERSENPILISAVPSNECPAIFLAVDNLVALSADPMTTLFGSIP